jgi:hypothetical protein
MKLGSIVAGIRLQGTYTIHREELDAMGLPYERQRSTFEEVKTALLAYKSLYGHLRVSQSYIIGDDYERYPEEVRGIKLGNVVAGIRLKGTYSYQREELQGMGLPYKRQRSTFEEVKTALLGYKALYGHLRVPYSYVIGEDDERYPEEVRGITLGSMVSIIRNSGHYADHREELQEMGFLFERQYSTFEEVKTALLAYKALYGHLRVSQSYIIGDDDERYPEEVRGMKLGNVVAGIRFKGTYSIREKNCKEWDFTLNDKGLPSKKSRQHC